LPCRLSVVLNFTNCLSFSAPFEFLLCRSPSRAGGRSTSAVQAVAGGALKFSGIINTNGGGFASARGVDSIVSPKITPTLTPDPTLPRPPAHAPQISLPPATSMRLFISLTQPFCSNCRTLSSLSRRAMQAPSIKHTHTFAAWHIPHATCSEGQEHVLMSHWLAAADFWYTRVGTVRRTNLRCRRPKQGTE
jgi:hypothetical protein